jgi:superfamily II DNA/RNA helicase
VAQRNSTATNVRQIVFEVAEGDKQAAVVQLIRERNLKQVLVFCNSKIGAGRLARQLERDGIVASAIHGDKSQNERMQALEAFKRGELEALVATDVAARGLDIVELPTVINFDLPFSAEDYVHRIGRTGRAGASGDALSLCTPHERKQLADIEKLIKRPLDVETLSVTSPAREPSHGRSEGRARYDSDERGERGRRRAAPVERHHTRSVPKAAEDDFFSKPYEPAQSAFKEPEQTPRPASKRPLAALLGGLPRKSS